MSIQHTPATSSAYGKLIAELKNSSIAQLRKLLAKMFDEANVKLLDMADATVNGNEKDTCYMLIRKLKEYGEDVAVDFEDGILSMLRPYTVTQAEETASKKEDNNDELSLVAQDDMEDIVLVKNLSTEITGKFREKITNLEIRLDHLALKTTEIFVKNALSPNRICQAYADAILEQFELPERQLMFKLFKDDVADQLGNFYDKLNKQLIDAGVLPQIKAQARGGGRRGRSAHAQVAEVPQDLPTEADTIGDAGGHYADGGGYGDAGGYGYSDPYAAPGGIPGAEPGGMPGAAPGGMSGAAPGGMPGAAPGGMPGAAPGGMPGAAPGGMPGAAPGAMPGAAPGGMPGAAAGGTPGAAPGGTPGAAAGGMPGATPGAMPGATPDGMPGAAPGAMPGAAPSGMPGAASAPQGGATLGNYPAGQTAALGGTYGNAHGAGGRAASADQSGPAGGGFSGSLPPPNAQGVYQHHTAGLPASQVSQTIGNYLGTPLTGGGAAAAHSGEQVAAYPASTELYYGHDEILTALSHIQTQPQFVDNPELRFNAEIVKQAVLSAIADKSGGLVTKRINQIAEKTIDFIELIFDAIIDDENISDTIKALLLRLQIPVIKASMLDQEFFIYDDHPARILLDRITEVGMGVTQHTDEIYVRLDKIVNQLINEYELDTKAFQYALDKLNDYIKEREEQARIKEEEAQKQTLREHARNAVLKSLRNITAGKALPESIHTLILKRWPTMMFNHYIDHGKENDGWVAIVELLRDLVESVQPFQSAEDYAYLLTEKDNLIERVNLLLSTTYKSKKDIRSVLDSLINTYDELIEDANYLAEEIETAEQVIAETPREKEPIKPEPPHVPETKLPSNVMPGMWFQIVTENGGKTRRCKLSVIIVEDEKLIFVTHDGELIAEKSFKEFTEELDRGVSKVIMGHSVFDYALNSVITKLEPTVH